MRVVVREGSCLRKILEDSIRGWRLDFFKLEIWLFSATDDNCYVLFGKTFELSEVMKKL